MRKWIVYLLTALFLAVSCVSEFEQEGSAVDDSLEGAPVTITFSVPDISVLPATKSSLEEGDGNITDTPFLDPEKMYLVVCGGSQSIKYIRKAKLVEIEENVEIPEDKYPLSEGDRKTNLYKFSVQLELSDFARTIHILGNVDENQLITGSYSYQSLPNILSFDKKQAYWQKLVVPSIKAKIDPVTGPVQDANGYYVPSDETLAFFQYVPLIRNFAKIKITNESDNFNLHSYAVIYYPERGSVVPFRTNESEPKNGFDFNPGSSYLSGYEKSSFEQLDGDIQYLGNMPSNVALNDIIPPASEFEDPDTSEGRVLLYDEDDDDQGFYIYERGVPTDKIGPTFIIICGKFEDDDQWYFYRMDLMETEVEGGQTVSKYYPIYRNFRYNIVLHRISSEGVLTPELAAVSSGVKDISADVSMRHLSDISNGTTRLVVEPFMTRTYSGPAEEGSYYELYARFFNDVYSDVPNCSTVAVRVELVPMEGGEDDILILYDNNGNRVPKRGFFFPNVATTVGGVEGIRTIRFNTVKPLDETKTQKIKITGHNPGNPQDLRLYREVEITLQKKQPLAVTCTDPVLTATNSPVEVGISIPSELPESMFPLDFIVEPEAGTLTPDVKKNINMPVVSGRSIATAESDFKDVPAFYYIRTLTWEEFSELGVSGGLRTFYCYFRSTEDRNATTVWVYNEYFEKGSAAFENKYPISVSCTNPVLGETGTPVTVGITIYSKIPESMFPLNFSIETKDASLQPKIPSDESLKPSDIGDGKHFIRTLTWEEYSNLLKPASRDECTFNCYFETTKSNSATTIGVENQNFDKCEVSFKNAEEIPDRFFYIEAIEGKCTVTLKNAGKYKIDDGGWIDFTANWEIVLAAGQKVSFSVGSNKSKKTDWQSSGQISGLQCTGGNFKVGGNIASLIVGDDYESDGTTVTGKFIDFFKAKKNLIDASDLEIPMLTVIENGYKSMFDSCVNMEHGPQTLPATSLGKTCYRNMFYNCSKLENAPELLATKLSQGAYQRMFYGCAKISSIKMLGKENYRDDCFISDGTTWCAGVASSGTIYLDKSLNPVGNYGTTWNKIVPEGWTVEYVE